MTDAASLAAFDIALAEAADAAAPLAALHRLAEGLAGVRVFSVTLIDLDAGMARRVYTTHPADYPVGGTKPVVRNAWFEVIADGQIYHRNSLDRMVEDFPDHLLIASLGCGAVLNLPVVLGRQLVATVNLLDVEGAYPDRICQHTAEVMSLPGKAAVMLHSRLKAAAFAI